MNSLLRFKFFLWCFSHVKVPMIGYVRPRLIKLDEQTIIIRIPLTRRTRNHLHSMYFGALAVGADLAGGFHGFYHAQRANCPISLAFKSFQANFLKRPTTDVYFVCNEGTMVQKMINETKQNGLRINKTLQITAYTDYFGQKEAIAHFLLELSLKKQTN